MENVLLVIGGLFGLFFGGEFLIKGAGRIALRLRVPSLIIGLTIVSVGTSMPELLVSVQAALRGIPEIAVGNVIGSNIANIGLILGIGGVLHAINVKRTLVRREIPMMIGVTALGTLFILDGQLQRLDGLILVAGFVAVSGLFYWLAQDARKGGELTDEDPHENIDPAKINVPLELARVGVSIVALFIGSEALINGSTAIARALFIPEFLIGLTMVAVGTSLPELVTTIVASRRGENDILVGNIVGSNIANLLLVLGMTTVIQPFAVTGVGALEIAVMNGFALLLPFAINNHISFRESALLLGAYTAFVVYSFVAVSGAGVLPA